MIKKNFFGLILVIILGIISFGQGDSDAALNSSADRFKDKEPVFSSGAFSPKYPKNRLTKELKEKLKLSESEKTNLKNRLKDSKINAFKLWNNLCQNTKIIDVNKDQNCLQTSEYIFGSVYSFEAKDYVPIYAGISFTDGSFHAPNHSLLAQVMLDLGENGLENLDKQNAEIVRLSSFALLDKTGKSIWKDEVQKNGLQEMNVSDKMSAQLNHTYLLRSVFLDRHQLAPRYKETVYAFQCVKFADNIAIILWKKISSRWV